jgi:hypothetical protein
MSALSRVAAYTTATARDGVDLVDTAATPAGRVDLTVADLQALLAIHEQCCDAVEHCEACGAVLCDTHGLGEAAACPADRVHCATSPWCWCDACLAAHRDDDAEDARDEGRTA